MNEWNNIKLSSYQHQELELSIITQYIKKEMIISLTIQQQKENIVISQTKNNKEEIKKILDYTSHHIPHAFSEVINFIYYINKDLFNSLYSEYF